MICAVEGSVKDFVDRSFYAGARTCLSAVVGQPYNLTELLVSIDRLGSQMSKAALVSVETESICV